MTSPLVRWKYFCEVRDKALLRNSRSPQTLQVVAVSKHHDAAAVACHLRAADEFPRDLGENYLQELQAKAADLDLKSLGVRWHFIGNLQSRKISDVCKVAQVIHSVGREKELKVLSDLRISHGQIPKFYLQFNISSEGTKNGFQLSEALFAQECLEKYHLKQDCLGLMGSAAPIEDVGEAGIRKQFALLRQLRDLHFKQASLNMGMSADFDLAIDEGSDLIRVGTILFGERA